MTTTTEGPARSKPVAVTSLRGLRRRLIAVLTNPVVLSIWVSLSFVAIVAEPFGTNGILPLAPRVLYWGLLVGVSILVGNFSDAIAGQLVKSGNVVQVSALAIVLMTLVFAPMVWSWNTLFSIAYPSLGSPFQKLAYYVFVVTSAVFVLLAAIRPAIAPRVDAGGTQADADPCPEDIRPRLCRRLAHPDACILRLSAQDHLIEVATKEGVEHIRMRFADAVTETESLPGTCVHRSHWVALWAVDRLERRKDKLFVVLCNGDELPVSRTYRPRLEEARPELF